MEEKKNTKRNLIFYGILAALVLLSLGGYYFYQQNKEPETVAVVRLGSTELLRVDLKKDARYLIEDGSAREVDMDFTLSSMGSMGELEGHDLNLIEVKNGRVDCIEANCPDLTCVYIAPLDEKADGVPIACLPHGMIITVE